MIRLLKPDHARRIELEGVGLAPRPVDIDQEQTGFRALRTLRIYCFEPPAVIRGHAEEDEVFIVVLKGAIGLTMRSEGWSDSGAHFELREAEAAGATACAAYLPPHAEYALTPHTAADVAYARALPAGARSPAVFSSNRIHGYGPQALLDVRTHAERLRLQLWLGQTKNAAGELVSWDERAPGEALIHVRTACAGSVMVDALGMPDVALESWDTVAISPDERPQFRVAPNSSVQGLLVSAV